jgi:hydrogenase maturation protease
MKQKPILVLGLGNDLLKDDAVGLRVAGKLEAALAGNPEVEVRATSLFGLALLDELIGRDKVLLIDSYTDGGAEATIQLWDLEAAGPVAAPCPHFAGLGEIRVVMELLGLGFARTVRILAIPVSDPFTFSAEMTPAVAARVDDAVARALRVVREWSAADLAPAA